MTVSRRLLATGLLCAGFCRPACAQSEALVSKSVTHLFSAADRIFAFGDSGKAVSRVDPFSDPAGVRNGSFPYPGGAEGGVSWRSSVLIRSNAFVSDTVRVARAVALSYGLTWKSDSLAFPLPRSSTDPLIRGTRFTALAAWRDTLILGFGKLGLAFMPLAPENDSKLFSGASVSFAGLPKGADSTLPLIACALGSTCRIDTLRTPSGGLDSVVDVAVDSSAPDSIWLLVATSTGLRRGLLGGTAYPRVSLPGISDSAQVGVLRLAAAPGRAILWAFTGAQFFFSDDHGRSFRVPPSLPGLATTPAALTGFAAAPQTAIFGETTYVNFNLNRPGLVAFKRDSLLRNAGAGEIADVLIEAEDSLNLVRGEGSLTELCVARGGNEAVLAAGSSVKGLFYRKLGPGSGKTFSNLNRLRGVKNSLGEIITYPTLFSGATVDGVPEVVHIGYRLKKDGKITITVFNYAMEKVRVLVKNAPRRGGAARSENTAEDKWDGRDASGRPVSVGTYYIRVESDQGESGFGKALCVRGRQ